MQQIQPILVFPERQKKCADRLIRYCRELDGTEILAWQHSTPAQDEAFIKEHPRNTWPNLQATGLHAGAERMAGKPFIWLECDAVPLKPGWVQEISQAYWESGKDYLFSADTHPPFDLVGGIGVYGPNTSTEIPHTFERDGWDLWMIKNIRHQMTFTPLIQHSYGVYSREGLLRHHLFPRDNKILRDDAVIFHKDQFLGLIDPHPLRFFHSGEIGDIIACLPTIRQLGGGTLFVGNRPHTRPIDGARYKLIEPLLEAQSYIDAVAYDETPEEIAVDFSKFRPMHRVTHCLAESQARYANIDKVDLSPWLMVEPNPVAEIVLARSERYNNNPQLWRRILELCRGHETVFVGTDAEHERFETMYRTKVRRYVIKDYLDLAQVIAGAKLFCGNQSSPCWVAMGLGVQLIQETYRPQPDSMVHRPNAQFRLGSSILPVTL